MTRIGITGHQGLPDTACEFITREVRGILAEQEAPLIGLTSLAEGADQLVAEQILAYGGELHVVIPSRHYETTFHGAAAVRYRKLFAAAASVDKLPFPKPTEQAYDAAGEWVARHCEMLIAVWDGLPARGLGGTADAVAHARALGRDVRVVWPDGVARG